MRVSHTTSPVIRNTRADSFAAKPVIVIPPITKPAAVHAPTTGAKRLPVSAKVSTIRVTERRVCFLKNEIAITATAPNKATKVGLYPSNRAHTIAANGTRNNPPFFIVSDRGGTALLSRPFNPSRTEVKWTCE